MAIVGMGTQLASEGEFTTYTKETGRLRDHALSIKNTVLGMREKFFGPSPVDAAKSAGVSCSQPITSAIRSNLGDLSGILADIEVLVIELDKSLS